MGELKVVGKIEPPAYKDPATMLRNIAEDIDEGKHGDVETIVVAIASDTGHFTFGGGRESDMHAAAFLFGAAHVRLLNIPWGGA